MFGDSAFYHPDQSPIANVFDVSSYSQKEHFLLPFAISILSSKDNSRLEGGFVETGKLYEHLQGLGFTPDQIDQAIIRGTRKKLIETAARRIPEPGQVMPQALRATNVGRYHIERLCNQFAYIDAVIVDVPVFDKEIRSSIHEERYIEDRLDRAELFCNYLDHSWSEFFPGKPQWFDWKSHSRRLKNEIEFISSKLDSY